ncbi:hypothetical protein F4810DRAFT_725675 [Camillea tinctor]|nr:hypothetical protein F4810DRAFT_725675 [Camillea tinctor]
MPESKRPREGTLCSTDMFIMASRTFTMPYFAQALPMASSLAGYQTGQLLCGGGCKLQHVAIPAPNQFPEPKNGWPETRGLDVLQRGNNEWLNRTAIEEALMAYLKGFPLDLQERVHIETSGLSNIFNQGVSGNNQFESLLGSSIKRFNRTMREKEYTLWPINFDGIHWQLIVLHKGKSDPKADYDIVRQVGYYDSWRINQPAQRRTLIIRRIRTLLIRQCNMQFSRNFQRDVWIPFQNDNNSCGPRTYWGAKQFLDRLLNIYEAGKGYDESLWNPNSGWYDNHFVRNEMIGRIAWLKVRQLNYNARVGVELINEIDEGKASLAKAGVVMQAPNYGPNKANWPTPDKPPIKPQVPKTVPTGVVQGSSTTISNLLGPAVPNEPKIAPGFNPKGPEYITLGDSPPTSKGPVFAAGPKAKAKSSGPVVAPGPNVKSSGPPVAPGPKAKNPKAKNPGPPVPPAAPGSKTKSGGPNPQVIDLTGSGFQPQAQPQAQSLFNSMGSGGGSNPQVIDLTGSGSNPSNVIDLTGSGSQPQAQPQPQSLFTAAGFGSGLQPPQPQPQSLFGTMGPSSFNLFNSAPVKFPFQNKKGPGGS